MNELPNSLYYYKKMRSLAVKPEILGYRLSMIKPAEVTQQLDSILISRP